MYTEADFQRDESRAEATDYLIEQLAAEIAADGEEIDQALGDYLDGDMAIKEYNAAMVDLLDGDPAPLTLFVKKAVQVAATGKASKLVA